MRALVADIVCLARRDGVVPTVRKIGRGLGGDELIVLEKRLDDIEEITLEQRLHITDLDAAHLPELAAFNRRRCDSRATARFADALERGHRGYLARVDGEVAGFYWWVAGEHPHLERLGITLRPGDVYGFDFYLAGEHRGEGRAVEFLHGIETRLQALGYERVWGYVRSDNRPARWLYSLRGYESVGSVHLKRGRMP